MNSFPKMRGAGRTPLFSALREAMRLAALSEGAGAPPSAELVESEQRWSRRKFLKAPGAAAVSLRAGEKAETGRKAAEAILDGTLVPPRRPAWL
jgi:hypothetical protein